MATTACASVGSSSLSPMKQLHAVACRSSPSMLLPHPCKLAFLFYLPTRLSPITSPRHRLPLSPPFCGHGELEIISIKELADGFLHFSFGAPASANKVDDLSSSCGEHLAGKLSVPRRLPSKFSRKSPIPVASVKHRRRQGESSPKEGSVEVIPLTVKEAVKSSSRPKSCFVKRSPIPNDNSEHMLVRERKSNGMAVHDKNMIHQGTKAGHVKSKKSMRPMSIFVRKSPIPVSAGKLNNMRPIPSANSDPSPTKVGNMAPTVRETSSVSLASRPKANFLRRSPIVKDQHLSPSVSTTRRQSSRSSHEASTNIEANAKGQNASDKSHHLSVDLEKCKLPELKNLAKIKGIKGYSKLKKAELLDLLKNLDS